MKYDLAHAVKAADKKLGADVLGWFQTSFGNLHYVMLFRRGMNLASPYSVHSFMPESGEFHAGSYCQKRSEAEGIFAERLREDAERCRHQETHLGRLLKPD